MKIEHLDNSSEVRTALGICTPEPKGLSETKLRNSAAANPIRTDEPKLRPTQAVSVRTNADSRERTQTPAPASYFRTNEPNPSAIHAPIRESEAKLQSSKPLPHERTQTSGGHTPIHESEPKLQPQQAISARTNPNYPASTRQFARAKPNSSPASHSRTDEPKPSDVHAPIHESEPKLQSQASPFRTDEPKLSGVHASIHESEPKLQPPASHFRTDEPKHQASAIPIHTSEAIIGRQ
jgi:hypothetical protein